MGLSWKTTRLKLLMWMMPSPCVRGIYLTKINEEEGEVGKERGNGVEGGKGGKGGKGRKGDEGGGRGRRWGRGRRGEEGGGVATHVLRFLRFPRAIPDTVGAVCDSCSPGIFSSRRQSGQRRS